MDTQKRIIMWVAVTLVLGVTGVGVWQTANNSGNTTVKTEGLAEAISARDHTKGRVATSTASLVEYSDFQCPACGAYYPLVEKIMTEYKDRLSFTYRHFPLPQHKNALAAAYAAEAAGKQGKFWEMYQLIFEYQTDWSEEGTAMKIFEGYARDIKLDLARWNTDVGAQETKDTVADDKATGVKSGVNSTPSFFLNGKKIPTPQDYAAFKAVIEYAIAHP